MWRLVIETGGEACQVGLMRGNEGVGGWRWDWARRHAERLVWMVAEVLKVEGLDWSEVQGWR
jgi:tRNA A37 threonylcarbamoyladenosine modification protein TsaB